MSQEPGTPGFELSIGSQSYNQQGGEVLSLMVEHHVDMVSMLTVRLSLGEHQSNPSWSHGDAVSCRIGEAGVARFDGEVVSIEPHFSGETLFTVVIRALDRTHRLARGRVTRIFENQKDSDVVAKVGAECGLTVSAEDTGEVYPYILQRNESNLAFLKRLAARNNYQLRVHEGQLLFQKAQYSDAGHTLTMGENILWLKTVFNTMDMVQEVVVRGWSVADKAEIVGTASSGDVDPIGSGELGMDIAARFGQSTAYITDVPVYSQGAADAVARSEINRLARQFARGQCKIQGTHEVYAGGMVTFENAPAGSNGSFHVLSCRQVISPASGWITEFSFCGTSYGT